MDGMKNKARFTNRISLMAGVFLLMVSCSTITTPTVQKSDMDKVDQSMELPETNITAYDDALHQLGLMLTAYSKPVTKTHCRPIVNATAHQKLPSDLSQLTQTAISKIGPKLLNIDYDRQQLAVDLARNETSMERIAPDLAVKGGITEYDQKMEKSRQMEGDALAFVGSGQIDAGMNLHEKTSAATVAMDFLLIDYKTQTTIPYVQAANRMNLFSSNQGSDFGISVFGSGIGVNCKVQKSQGLHAGLRLLVELSVLEIIGKYHCIPYWRCVPGAAVDEHLVKRFEQELKQDPDVLLTMKRMAYAHGKAMDLNSGGLSENEIQELFDLKRHYGLDPEAENDYEFMKRMWLNLPFGEAADRMKEIPDPKELQRMRLQAAQRAQAEAQAEAEALARQEAEAAEEKKRTTLKFGAQESF
jgi:hypothetical protein